MLTEFGKYLRTLRMNRGELLKDMAQKINVSSAYLSAVEFGEKTLSKEKIASICEIYALSEEEKRLLNQKAQEAVLSVKFNLKKASESKREATLLFARTFEAMDDELAKRIISIFEERK